MPFLICACAPVVVVAPPPTTAPVPAPASIADTAELAGLKGPREWVQDFKLGTLSRKYQLLSKEATEEVKLLIAQGAERSACERNNRFLSDVKELCADVATEGCVEILSKDPADCSGLANACPEAAAAVGACEP